MEDHYRRHLNPQATDRQLLQVARFSTLAFGIGSAVWALFFANITDILVFTYDFWGPIMIVPFLVGLFWYAPSRIHAVVIAMFAGLTATAVWRFALHSPGDLGPALFGFLVAVAAFLVSLPATRGLPLTRLFQPGNENGLNSEDGG
jgi:SSS family solute:Na+ symporter